MAFVAQLLEAEFTRREIVFGLDAKSGRYVIRHGGIVLNVSLESFRHVYERDNDVASVARFLDAMLSSPRPLGGWEEERAAIYFCLEPSTHSEAAQLREAVSERVDGVAIHYNARRNVVTWITEQMLSDWRVSPEQLALEASANLARALAAARIDYYDIGGRRIGSLATELPFKTALLLAPNLKEVISPTLGWPLLAVVPDRDFLHLWDARHEDMLARMERVVVREFGTAPYPLTTEVFLIADDGIATLCAFPRG